MLSSTERGGMKELSQAADWTISKEDEMQQFGISNETLKKLEEMETALNASPKRPDRMDVYDCGYTCSGSCGQTCAGSCTGSNY